MSNQQLLDTDSKHSFSIASIVDKSWNRIVELAFGMGWSPIARVAEYAVIKCVARFINIKT